MYLLNILPSLPSYPHLWMKKSTLLGLLALFSCNLILGSTYFKPSEGSVLKPPLNSLNPALTCNEITAINSQHFSSLSAQIVDNVPSVIPLCLGGVTGINNLTDTDENNFTNISLTGIGCDATLACKSTIANSAFDAGTFAGFRVGSQGLIGAGVVSEISCFNLFKQQSAGK
jgi:hypothetical protein